MHKRDLSINFLNFQCENPFFLAASPVARTSEMIMRAFEMGWGGAVSKSISLDQDTHDHGLSPRFTGISNSGSAEPLWHRLSGLSNIDFRIDNSVEATFKDLSLIKKKYPNKFFAISLKGQFLKEEWQKLAELASDTGADAIELCLSCPDEPSGTGTCCGSIGQNPEGIQQVISWVKGVSSLPVLVKLTSHVQSISLIGLAVQEGGGNGISAVNSFKGLAGIDLETLEPLPTIEGISTSPGITGGLIKPLAQYCVYELCKSKEITIPVSGVGGVLNSQDALEYFLLGASTVQIATGVMFEGYRIIEELTFGLSDFMEKKGFNNLEDFRGKVLSKYVGTTKGLSRRQQLLSNINPDLCTRCGRCYLSCRDGAYSAINFDAARNLSVDKDKCVGCGLCEIVCPVPGAIYFTRNKDWE